MNQIETLELKISKFLRIGVFVAVALMFIGWIFQLIHFNDSFSSLSSYQVTPLQNSVLLALENKSWDILASYFGLTVLISLPVIRVLLTAILFMKQKEYIMASLAFFVLIALILSFSLGVEL